MSPAPFQSGIVSVGVILAVMAFVAVIETALPLHARNRWSRAHLAPNLVLTFITLATNIFLNVALVLMLIWFRTIGFGALHHVALAPFAIGLIAVLGLDLSSYVAHVAMHKVPNLWRFHAVHHSDPTVDVTTTIRQHPGESLIRFGFLTAAALALGVSPGAFTIYRAWSALSGLFEHANIRLPQRLDRLLVLFVSTPDMHKIHHSRLRTETDTNYGNITSLFDRLFFTYTPSRRGRTIAYGLDGLDKPSSQTTRALLALPFRTTLS